MPLKLVQGTVQFYDSFWLNKHQIYPKNNRWWQWLLATAIKTNQGHGHYNRFPKHLVKHWFHYSWICVCVCPDIHDVIHGRKHGLFSAPTSPHGERRPRAWPATVPPGRLECRGWTWTLWPLLEVQELKGKSPHYPPACVCLPAAAAGASPPNVSPPIHHRSRGLHDRLTLNYDTLRLCYLALVRLLKCTIHWLQFIK